MITSPVGSKKVDTAHTIQEFISFGNEINDYSGYKDLAYIENRDGLEFNVKQVVDDYLYELKQLSETVEFSEKYILKYRYNPKLLAYDLYYCTRIYYMILKLNDMCNIHDFSIKKRKLVLLPPASLKKALTNIYASENQSLKIYKKKHDNDIISQPIDKYVYMRDPIARFLSM